MGLQVDAVTSASRSARVGGILVYLVALTCWVTFVGLPKQTIVAFLWIWLATIAWNIHAPIRAHLAFPRDWWPPLVVLMIYLYSRGLADDLGFVSVHVIEPIQADRWLFGGILPTEYLQAHLCGSPCERSMPPRWYDVVLTTVYYSHFFVALVTAWVLWLRNRSGWVRFMRRYLTLNIVGLALYITYPMAPPWMAARDGYLSADIARITGRGWYDLSDNGFHQHLSAVGNPVAAMPSLHAGIALLVAVYGIMRLRGGWRWLLLLYPVAMSFMLVYYAEHYVVDILAGYAAAGLVLWVCAVWERLPRRERVHAPVMERRLYDGVGARGTEGQ
jgi:PAP2 superfamily